MIPRRLIFNLFQAGNRGIFGGGNGFLALFVCSYFLVDGGMGIFAGQISDPAKFTPRNRLNLRNFVVCDSIS
jgi:hypothetical protein